MNRHRQQQQETLPLNKKKMISLTFVADKLSQVIEEVSMIVLL